MYIVRRYLIRFCIFVCEKHFQKPCASEYGMAGNLPKKFFKPSSTHRFAFLACTMNKDEYYNNSKNKDSVSRPKLPLYFNKHVYTCMYICRRKLDPFFLPSSSPLPFLLSFYRKKKQRRFVNIVKPSTTSYSLSLTTSAITWWKILKR